MDKAKIYQTIEYLSNMHGVSGFESSIADAVCTLFKPYVDEISIDALGSVIACKKSKKKNAKKIMLDAHMDEIGLMVTKIDDKGFLKFTNIGGIDERILPSSEVIVHAKRDILGIIGIKPPHLQSAEESKKTIKPDELAIDIGMDKEAASKLVEVGDVVTFNQKACSLLNSQMTGKSFDDRASICALLYTAEKLSSLELDVDVYFVLSTFEETNLAGAKCSAYTIAPDCALVIDVTHAKTPDNSECSFDVGGGVAYSLGPNVHTPLAKLIKSIAEKNNIDASAEVDGASTGTNAWSVQISRTGVATAVLSLPLKYMHTPTEVVSVNDVMCAGELGYEFVCALNNDSSIIETTTL